MFCDPICCYRPFHSYSSLFSEKKKDIDSLLVQNAKRTNIPVIKFDALLHVICNFSEFSKRQEAAKVNDDLVGTLWFCSLYPLLFFILEPLSISHNLVLSIQKRKRKKMREGNNLALGNMYANKVCTMTKLVIFLLSFSLSFCC